MAHFSLRHLDNQDVDNFLTLILHSCSGIQAISNKRNKPRISIFFTCRNLLEGADSGKLYAHLLLLVILGIESRQAIQYF